MHRSLTSEDVDQYLIRVAVLTRIDDLITHAQFHEDRVNSFRDMEVKSFEAPRNFHDGVTRLVSMFTLPLRPTSNEDGYQLNVPNLCPMWDMNPWSHDQLQVRPRVEHIIPFGSRVEAIKVMNNARNGLNGRGHGLHIRDFCGLIAMLIWRTWHLTMAASFQSRCIFRLPML